MVHHYYYNCLLFIIILPVTDMHVMLNRNGMCKESLKEKVTKDGLNIIYTF